MDNVNNLNGIPNFGHGMPEDGVVEAGITDVPQDAVEEAPEEEEQSEVEPEEEAPAEVEVTNQDEN